MQKWFMAGVLFVVGLTIVASICFMLSISLSEEKAQSWQYQMATSNAPLLAIYPHLPFYEKMPSPVASSTPAIVPTKQTNRKPSTQQNNFLSSIWQIVVGIIVAIGAIVTGVVVVLKQVSDGTSYLKKIVDNVKSFFPGAGNGKKDRGWGKQNKDWNNLKQNYIENLAEDLKWMGNPENDRPDIENHYIPLHLYGFVNGDQTEMDGEKDCDPESLIRRKQIKIEKLSYAKVEGRTTLIVGGAGSGKTFYVKHLAWLISQKICKRQRNIQQKKNELNRELAELEESVFKRIDLPIYIDLKRVDRSLLNNSRNPDALLKLAVSALPNHPSLTSEQMIEYMKYEVEQRKVLLLVDGLDETMVVDIEVWEREAKELYQHVVTMLNRYLSSMVIIVTMRQPLDRMVFPRPLHREQHVPEGAEPNLKGQHLELANFRLIDMRECITSWSEKKLISNPDLQQIVDNNVRFQEFGSNPEALWQMSKFSSGSRDGRWAFQRSKLFEEYVNSVLNTYEDRRRSIINVEQKQHLLAALAWHMHQQDVYSYSENTLKEVLKDLLREVLGWRGRIDEVTLIKVFFEITLTNSLLREENPFRRNGSEGSYRFLSISLQEYFAAKYVFEKARSKTNPAALISEEQVLIRHSDDPWWEEVILLYIHLCRGIKDATKNDTIDSFVEQLTRIQVHTSMADQDPMYILRSLAGHGLVMGQNIISEHFQQIIKLCLYASLNSLVHEGCLLVGGRIYRILTELDMEEVDAPALTALSNVQNGGQSPQTDDYEQIRGKLKGWAELIGDSKLPPLFLPHFNGANATSEALKQLREQITKIELLKNKQSIKDVFRDNAFDQELKHIFVHVLRILKMPNMERSVLTQELSELLVEAELAVSIRASMVIMLGVIGDVTGDLVKLLVESLADATDNQQQQSQGTPSSGIRLEQGEDALFIRWHIVGALCTLAHRLGWKESGIAQGLKNLVNPGERQNVDDYIRWYVAMILEDAELESVTPDWGTFTQTNIPFKGRILLNIEGREKRDKEIGRFLEAVKQNPPSSKNWREWVFLFEVVGQLSSDSDMVEKLREMSPLKKQEDAEKPSQGAAFVQSGGTAPGGSGTTGSVSVQEKLGKHEQQVLEESFLYAQWRVNRREKATKGRVPKQAQR